VADNATAFWFSLISLVISAATAGIGVFKFLSEFHHHLSTQMMWRVNHDGQDHELLIMNGGSGTVGVYYYSLDWMQPSPLGKWCPIGRKELRNELGSEDEFADFAIPANGKHVWHFDDEHAIGRRPSDKAVLCLRLWLVGRNRPVWLWIQ